MNKWQLKQEIGFLDRKLDHNLHEIKAGMGRIGEIQHSPLVQENLPTLFAGALLSGLAAGYLSKKCGQDLEEMAALVCRLSGLQEPR